MISLLTSLLLSLSPGSHENIVIHSASPDTLFITTQTEGSVRTAHMDFMLPQSWSIVTVTRTDTGRVARVMVRVSNHRDFDTAAIVVVYPLVSGVASGGNGAGNCKLHEVPSRAPLQVFDILGRRVSKRLARQVLFTYP